MATDDQENTGDAKPQSAGDWAEALDDGNGATSGALDAPGGVLSGDARPKPFSKPGASDDSPVNDINMVLDIPVQLSVELGRTKVSIKHILQLGQGSVVELDALAGEPMDVLVNGYLIAQGEVVVVNDKFGIRLTDVVTPSERLRRINKG